MSSISQNPQFNTFVSGQFTGAAQDQQINRQEGQQLLQAISQMELSSQDRAYVEGMIQSLQNATTTRGVLGGERATSISPQNRQILENLSQSNAMAAQLLNAFDAPAQVSTPVDSEAIDNAVRMALEAGDGDPAGVQFAPPTPQAAQAQEIPTVQRMRSASQNALTQPEWYLNQYNTGLPTSQGDCGPTSAAMVARSFGYATDLSETEAVDTARTAANGPRTGRVAISEAQLSQAVREMTGQNIQQVGDTERFRAGDEARLAQSIRESLQQGLRPVLLSAQSQEGNQDARHYMVIAGEDPSRPGNFLIADPAQTFLNEFGEAPFTSVSDPRIQTAGNNSAPADRVWVRSVGMEDLASYLRETEETDNVGSALLSYGRVQ